MTFSCLWRMVGIILVVIRKIFWCRIPFLANCTLECIISNHMTCTYVIFHGKFGIECFSANSTKKFIIMVVNAREMGIKVWSTKMPLAYATSYIRFPFNLLPPRTLDLYCLLRGSHQRFRYFVCLIICFIHFNNIYWKKRMIV